MIKGGWREKEGEVGRETAKKKQQERRENVEVGKKTRRNETYKA